MCLNLWCMNMRGPLFVSSFNPVMLIFVAIFGSLLLEEKLYLGRYVCIYSQLIYDFFFVSFFFRTTKMEHYDVGAIYMHVSHHCYLTCDLICFVME